MRAKRIIIVIISICIVLFTVFACTVVYFLQPLSDSAQMQEVIISKGISARAAGRLLEKNNIIRSSLLFYGIARYSNTVIKAGVYQLSPDMTYSQILAILEKGKDAQIIVSVPEGLTISRIASLLEEKGVVNAADFTSACTNPEVLKKFSIPSNTAQGYLFPDTYYLQPEMDAVQVVELFIENFYSKLKTIEGLEQKNSDELYFIVTLASIVEREYRREDEAPLIASVFTNRLKYNIGLYSCATIVYILTEIEGRDHPERITEKDTRIESPYNTYLYAGLPPTPISNPGLTALKAAAKPADTDYYYFRLIDEQSGTHTFTKNFDDHKEAGNSISIKRKAGN